MRLLLNLVVLFFFSTILSAQDAYLDNLFDELRNTYNITGGELVMQESESQNATATTTYGNISYALVDNDENPFKQYHSIQVNGEATNPWESGLNQRNANAIKRNDNVLVAFWIRGSSNDITSKVNFFVENSTTFEKEMLLTLELKEEWTQYLIPFSSLGTYNKDQLAVGLHLAYGVQTVEYAGITLINYKDNYTLQDLPAKQGDGPYDGFADDAPWRAEAEARIDQYRKADMEVQFTDLGGAPLKGVKIRVRMKKHEFEFGTAVNASLFANNGNHNNTYERMLTDLDGNGNGFNTVVFENSLKWRAWEGDWPTDKEGKIKAINYLASRDITMRGHNLLWPGWQVMPNYMESNKNDADYLVDKIKTHINNLLANPDIANNIKDWDVINEIATNRDIEDALKGKSGYETGREIYAEVFKQVKDIDPEIITYLNDYVTIGSNRNEGILYEEYKKFIREIYAAGGEIDGIGFQAHIGGSPTAPEKVYNILEDFYQEFGTEAKITEYDTDPIVSGDLGRKYMEDFLTIILSHQSVKGFLMWGFWDGAHWKQNAPMFNRDWTIKPAGEAFIKKVFDDWWVDETIITDEEGYIDLRAFKGEYEFYLEEADETFELQLQIDTAITMVSNLIISTSEVEFENEFSLFPNPANDIINISNKSRQAFATEVIDQLGRVLVRGSQSKSHQLDISNLNPGNYYIRITIDGDSYVKKIFKN